MTFSTRKVIIVGSGPAGYTAAIYASRAMLEPLVLAGSNPGGQLMLTSEVENFPGYPEGVSGVQMMDDLRKQAVKNGAEIVDESVSQLTIKGENAGFEIHTSGGTVIPSLSVIISSGAEARWLHKKNEDIFKGKGISTCATCDGFFFRKKKVVVVGGGDSAIEEALYLSRLCSEVLLIHRRDDFRASRVMVERAKKARNISYLLSHTVEEWCPTSENRAILGGALVRNVKSGNINFVPFDGAFIAVGHTPNSEFLGGKVPTDGDGYIKVDAGKTTTTIPGIFACGDVADNRYRQAITAAGMGCMAAMDCERYLSHFP